MTTESASPDVLTGYYLQRAAVAPAATAFYVFESQQWVPVTWAKFVGQAQRLANGLSSAGLQPGERVGIMAATGLAWEIFQLAALLNGAAVVGLDAHDQPERLVAIANASRLAMLVIDDVDKLSALGSDIPTLRMVIGIHGQTPTLQNHWQWRTWQALNSELQPQWFADKATPTHEATIVFTSGSTGAPKGIAYTHAQVCTAIDNILGAFPDITAADRLVCWLPLSNLFQRMLNFCAAARGAQSYFVSDPRAIIEHLPSIRPHVFIAVPRFFEKLNEGILHRLAKQSPFARGLVECALKVGDAVADRTRRAAPIPIHLRVVYRIFDNLVLKKLRGVLGGEVRFLVSGSAAFPRWLIDRFHAMGLLVLEAYGLSENVVPIAINRTNAFRFGSVGQVLPANEVHLADDGEVWVRGHGVFHGYLNEATTNLEPGGWLATGDLGCFDADNYLHLVGRKSEVFKTSTGRKIAPIGIEAKLKRIEGVDQTVIFGAGRKAIIALITLNLDLASRAELAPIARQIAAQVSTVLRDESDYMQPAGLVITRRAFSIEGGELTSNLKLRRKVIEANYAKALEHLFSKLDAAQAIFTEAIDTDTCVVNC